MNFEIRFEWDVVQNSEGAAYSFPDSPSIYLRQRYSKPAIYRWVIECDGTTATYIGETVKLHRRLVHYLKPGRSQYTNIRLKALFDAAILSGASISLEVLRFSPFSINGVEYSAENLLSKEMRCFLENLLITQISASVKKLNVLIAMKEKLIATPAKRLEVFNAMKNA